MKALVRNLLIILLCIVGAVYIGKVYYNSEHLKAVAKAVKESTESR